MPKSKLTDEMIATLAGHVRNGLTHRDAAQLAGINESTLTRWKNRAEDSEDGPALPLARTLCTSLKEAESGFKQANLAVIRRSANEPYVVTKEYVRKSPDGSIIMTVTVTETRPPAWQPAGWLLERKIPVEFGKRLEHSGRVGVDGGIMIAPSGVDGRC